MKIAKSPYLALLFERGSSEVGEVDGHGRLLGWRRRIALEAEGERASEVSLDTKEKSVKVVVLASPC